MQLSLRRPKAQSADARPPAATLPSSTVGKIVLAGIFLLPILLLPLAEQFVLFSKTYLMLLLGIVVLTAFALSIFRKRSLRLTFGPLAVPLLLFTGGSLAASVLTTNFPLINFLGMGGVFFFSGLIAWFGGSMIEGGRLARHALVAATASAVVVALAGILQFVGFGLSGLFSQIMGVTLSNTLAFSVTGAASIDLQLMVTVLAGLVAYFQLYRRFKPLAIVGLVTVIVGAALFAWAITPGQPGAEPRVPLASAWSIAIDTIKFPRQAILGVGPENVTSAYNLFKPRILNLTDTWNVSFRKVGNTPFTLSIGSGLVTAVGWLGILYALARQTGKVSNETKPIHYMLLASFGLGLVFPPSLVIAGWQGLLLAIWIAGERHRLPMFEFSGFALPTFNRNFQLNPTKQGTWVLPVLALLMLIGAAYTAFVSARGVAAEYLLLRSTQQGQAGQVADAYTLLQRSIQLNPFRDDVRARYAQININLARATIQQAAQQAQAEAAAGGEGTQADADGQPAQVQISDRAQQQFRQLVQQAIRESQAAVTLNPANTQNWRTVANVFTALIGTADGADQQAVNAYLQAIRTSPQDPIVRLRLGNLLFQLQQVADATGFYRQAVELKPDLAVARYNFANGLTQLQNLTAARAQYIAVLDLLDPSTDDYTRARDELDAVEAQLAQLQAQQAAAAEAGGATGQPGQPQLGQPAEGSDALLPQVVDDTGIEPDDQQVDLEGVPPVVDDTADEDESLQAPVDEGG